jgi:hypothetical protein
MCPAELAMFTNKTTRMFGVFAIVVATMLELVTAASMSASDSALAVKAGSSHSISKGKSKNSNSSANTTNTKPAKMIILLQLMNENLGRGHREEVEEQEKQIREEWEEIEWKMSAREHINYTTIDIEHDLPLPIINFRSKQS